MSRFAYFSAGLWRGFLLHRCYNGQNTLSFGHVTITMTTLGAMFAFRRGRNSGGFQVGACLFCIRGIQGDATSSVWIYTTTSCLLVRCFIWEASVCKQCTVVTLDSCTYDRLAEGNIHPFPPTSSLSSHLSRHQYDSLLDCSQACDNLLDYRRCYVASIPHLVFPPKVFKSAAVFNPHCSISGTARCWEYRVDVSPTSFPSHTFAF